MIDHKPLSSAEARKLSAYLGEDNNISGFTLNSLKGFLFALASGPAWLHDDDWKPIVFNQADAAFFDTDSGQFLNEAADRLFAQIRHQTSSNHYRLPNVCALIEEPWLDNFSDKSALQQWCQGFLQGHMSLLDWWEDYLNGDEELQEAIGTAVVVLGFYADLDESKNLAKIAFGSDTSFEDLACNMRSFMPGAIRSYAQIGHQLYEAHMPDQEFRQLKHAQRSHTDAGDNIIAFPFADQTRDYHWQAQQLIYSAWEASSVEERIELAHGALEIDSDCVDAYLILANDSCENRSEVLHYLELGLAAGEKNLGDSLSQDAGHFWQLPETRPFMRVKYGLAETLWELGRRDEALVHYKALLELDPEDHQGIRYVLISHLIELNDFVHARGLIARYDNDRSAIWLYSGALLIFAEQGDTAESRQSLGKARRSNRFVGEYLTSQKHLPDELPEYYGVGDEREAIVYAWTNRKLWRSIDGAIDWLSPSSRKTPDTLNNGAQ